MDQWHMLAGLAFGLLAEDDGSGPPPALPGHEAERRRTRRPAAPARDAAPGAGGASRRGFFRRSRGAAPAAVT
ncbi:hypothetical protein [Streptomyces marincola]|uniref:Uncharacterized protein n=1 Tax=Streptomyces marincola TaxID=2878388 RepID=A0A1W7D4V7_9ACTN|nr:hypothetical protein [Streptomyces marincola]ARQ72044.1 hypothetical protein CAG99_27305 [Streptomyces marincola]